MNSNIFASMLRLNASQTIRFTLARLAGLALVSGFACSSDAQVLDVILSTNLFEPSAVALDVGGNNYIADSANNRIAKLDATTRTATTLAGLSGTANFGAVDGFGGGARFFDPEGIVRVSNGFIIADTGNHLIRFVDSDGRVQTLAGDSDLAQQSIDAGFPPDTFGFQDGVGAAAQFNSPTAVAWDGNDSIYIADTQNDAIRKLRLSDRTVTTIATGFASPGGVAVGKDGRVYVADTGNNAIKIVETNGNVTLLAGSNSRFISGYADNANGAKSLFSAPRGILFIEDSAQLLVADSANAAVRRISDTRQAVRGVDTLVGPSAGLVNPVGLARDDDGTIIIVDRGANAVKAFRGSGLQPQISPPQIGVVGADFQQQCGGVPNPLGLPTSIMAETIVDTIFNNDVVVAIQPEHDTGIDLGVQTFYTIGPTDPLKPVPNPKSSDASPPKFFDCQPGVPESILFPIRPDTTIKAISTRADRRPSSVTTARVRFQAANPRVIGDSPSAFNLDSATTNAVIWYTFGSVEDEVPEPTNAPPSVRYTGKTINVANGSNNVFLKMRAFRDGYFPSSVVDKAFVQTNIVFTTLGAPSDLEVGPGASIVVPVEVTLAPKTQIRSFQYRAEISPRSGGETPGISFARPATNDFLLVEDPVFNPSQIPPQPILTLPQSIETFQIDSTNGVVVAYFGGGILVGDQIETVSYLRIDVPPSARHGDRYLLSFIDISATSDGDQQQVGIIPLPGRILTVSTNLSYIVGDSALGAGYNAGQFGDRNLRNDDGNNAFDADFGRRLPLRFTDAFSAMDAFPVDRPGQVGGDGIIRYLDWQIILRRSVELDPTIWVRRWVEGGVLVPSTTNLSFALSPAENIAANASQATNVIWKRSALLRGGNVNQVFQTNPLEVPVTLELRPGTKVSGMQFIAYVKPAGTQVPINGLSFVPALNVPPPSRVEANGADGIICAWNYDAFNPPLSGTNVIGKLAFSIPGSAFSNQHYEISFAYPDGALGLDTQIDFESVRGKVWVNSFGQSERLPDEWKIFFFGNLDNPLADAGLDPDHDGASNYIEYLDGTNPRASDFVLSRVGASGDILNFSWFASSSVQYSLEANPDLGSTNWSAVLPPVTGSGQVQTISYTNAAHLPSQSFRLRVNPQTTP